jgi:zinc transporter ZupT
MGNFGVVPGLILLALQLAAVMAGLAVTRRLAAAGGPLKALLLGLYTFAAAFAAHVLAFIVIRRVSPELFADVEGRRPFVMLAWAVATALTVRFAGGKKVGDAAAMACGLLAAGAYLLAVSLRG